MPAHDHPEIVAAPDTDAAAPPQSLAAYLATADSGRVRAFALPRPPSSAEQRALNTQRPHAPPETGDSGGLPDFGSIIGSERSVRRERLDQLGGRIRALDARIEAALLLSEEAVSGTRGSIAAPAAAGHLPAGNSARMSSTTITADAQVQTGGGTSAMKSKDNVAPRKAREASEGMARALVFDYLSQANYVSTARILSRGRTAEAAPVIATSNGGGAAPHRVQDKDVMMDSVADLAAAPGPGGHGTAMEVDGDDERGAVGGALVAEPAQKEAYLTEDEIQAMQRRKEICNHILAGEITEALRCIQEHIPRLLAPQTASSSGSGAMAVTTDDDDADSDSQSPPASPPGRGTALPAHMASERGAGSAGMSRKGSAASLAGGGAGNGAAGSAGSNGAGADGHGSLPPPPPFPYADSYDRPDFLKINLEIQQFVENLRHLVIPSSPSSSMASSMHSEAPGAGTGGSGSGGSKLQAAAVTNAMMTSNGGSGNLGLGASLASNGGGMGRDATVLHALAHAQSLHATAKRLRPAESRVYVQEIENACALLAYTDMEGSPLRGYLEQGRRTALAAQVNSAILVHTGHAPHPMLEQVAKQTTFLWQTMADHGVPVAPPWTSAVEGPEWERLAAFFRFRRKFDLSDFVADR